jgi:nitrogen regulatory protein PII-like uncharacterized protein
MQTKIKYEEEDRSQEDFEGMDIEEDSSSSIVPQGVRNLRACMICHLVKTEEQVKTKKHPQISEKKNSSG